MKKLKIVVSLFLFTCILSLNNIKADSYLNFASITVPSMQGIYTSSSVYKTSLSNQYIKKIAAIDKLSGDERTIGARLKDVTTYYAKTVKGSYVQLFNNNSGLGQTTGSYKLQLKAEKWTATSSAFSGSWILDDFLL